MGVDRSALLWSIAIDSGSVALAHNDVNGVFTASAALAGADQAFPWNVFFDSSGNTYAIGAAVGSNGADQLAVYKADAAGDAIVSVQTFDSGFNSNNLVFGAAAPGWIVGAVQTQGPIGHGSGTRSYSAAVWKFDPNAGLIQVATTTTRAGMDVATGVTLDPAGNLWVSGFSYSPSPRSARPFDLALWEYAPDGHTLLAGPFIREGYLAQFDTSMLARVAYSSGTIYVTAPRGRGAGGTDVALVAFNAANGNVIAESAWRPADLSSVYPSTLLQNAGNLLAAGSFDYGDGTAAGLWFYGPDGALTTAAQAAAGGAQGAAYSAPNLWLAVDGSTSPFLVNAQTPQPGGLSDIEPPRTSLAVATTSVFANIPYVATTTPLGFIAIDDALAVGDGAGVGAAQTYYSVDNASFSVLSSSFELVSEGTHTISFYSLDFEGNAEVIKSTAVAVDLTAPTVAVVSTGAYYALSVVDPVVKGAASGVALVQYLVDVPPNCNKVTPDPNAPPGTCANLTYAGPFSLAVGTHTIYFNAVDRMGNGQNVISSSYVVVGSTLAVDVTPPAVSFQVIGSSFTDAAGNLDVSSSTAFGLLSVDPLVNGAASGVKSTQYRVNGGSFTVYSGTFSFASPDGARFVAFQATDNAGNTSMLRGATVFLDATPPVTSLALSTPGFSGFVSSATLLSLSAVDPVSSGVASGVMYTRYRVNGGVFATSPLAFSLSGPDGVYQVDYQSLDNVSNLEVLRSTSVFLDQTPPVTTPHLGAPNYVAADGTQYVTPVTSVTFTAVDPSSGAAASGVNHIEIALDGGSFSVYSTTLTFAEGRHAVLYRAVDNAGNAEGTKTLSLQSDATPPVTALAISTPSFNGFVSGATLFSLSAVDPAVNGVASGVAFTRYRVNGGAFAAAPLAFRLAGPDGAYQVDYQSQDNATNLEILRSTAVYLDQTPPVTTPHLGAPSYVAADGTQYVTPATPVAFTTVDPSSGAIASGVDRIEVALDGGAFTVYSATLTFAEGRHTVAYRSVDNVGNVEGTKTLSLQSDATPPVTAFKASGAYYVANAPEGTRLYAPLAFAYTFPATDPVVNDVASGLAFTHYRSGQVTSYASSSPTYTPGAFAAYVSTFSLAEGIRRVDFQSQDNVSNLELLKSATVFVDATPPATALGIGAPQYAAGGTLYVSTATPFTLTSQDPVVQEVASGVAGIFAHLDANPFAPYSAAFTIPVPDGVRTASFYAADNVGNRETVKTSTVALDATAPQTSLLVAGGHEFPGPNSMTFYASADTRFVLPAIDPIVNDVASGLAFTRWQDNGGAFSAYVSTLALPEGAHALGYQSQDNVANLEVLRSTNIWIDATPPVTTVTIGSPTYTAADGTIYVTPAAPITFAASDPNLPSGQAGSGVNRIEISLDGGAYAPYAAALKLPEGRHVILYHAVDNVANVEAYHTLAVQSDATPPVSSLIIGQPQFQLPGVLLVSTRTPIAVAAVDPVVNSVASGVKDTWYNWADLAASTSAFTPFTAPFTLSGADVNKVVGFYSRDNVLNTEVVKSSTVLLDSTPPEISLLSPAACDSGICRVLKGKFPVLGTARDLHFASYVLDFAPGQSAATGYALINSATVAVSSATLGTWDASKLSGWQTLRLTATDQVANVSVLTINVFVGDPAALMLLGNHATFDMPTGVAAGADGKIYVADRDNDRVAVFTSTGGLAASFGGRRDDHGDDDAVSTSTLRLHEPAGVAVDAANNIYIADTEHQRVLKLSPAGQVLLDLGRRKVERDDGRTKAEFASGKAPGEFRHPLGVAVDAAGNIYVADTRNSRVQVFTSTGGFTLQFALPALPAPAADDDRDHEKDDDDARPALGRPAGIAVDAGGNVYVADVPGRRALRYDPSGRLTLTIPIPGDKPGQSGRPFGVAVSSSGECLLVSDMRFGHVLKFDVTGAQNLSFGVKGLGDDDGKPMPAGIVLRKPAGLALDAAGDLYVADRNAEKIEKFGLPTGQATVVVPPPGPGDDDTARDVVSREDGGKVERKDMAAVAIPAQAVSDDLKVSVSPPPADVAAAGARGAQDKDLKTASPPVDFGPEGTKFAVPVTLTLPYSADLLARENGDETSLKIHYWNKDKGQWEELVSQVDAIKHTVTAKTGHFSLYQVFATSSSAVAPLATADTTFGLKAAYAFPNPVRGTRLATLRVQPGLADSIEVHVYDVTGRRVYGSSAFALNGGLAGLDDGNGLGAQLTYDNVWDISGIGSGVYTFVITAKKAGAADIHKSGKIGVIK